MDNLSWREALDRLKEGNARFVSDSLIYKKQDSSRREQTSRGQHPFAIILSCADSRVVPELTFDTGLGELFVIRVAGNVANTSSIASIEYAVANLGVPLIVVMGHEGCGAVTAAIDGSDAGPNLNHLLSMIRPAVDNVEDKSVNTVVKENAKRNAKAMMEKSGIISSAVNNSDVKIVTGFYHLKSGKVDFDI